MFGTLRISHNNSEAQFIDRTGSVLGEAAMQRIACDFCRSKKLRCSGQRSGCERCKAVRYPCIYSPASYSRDSRKPNKRGNSAQRKAIKKRGFSDSTERISSPRAAPPRSCPDSCEHAPAHSLYQGGDPGDDQQQQLPQGSEMANVPTDNSIDSFPSTPTDPEGEFKALYESQMSLADELLGYSMSVNDPWASFATLINDTYQENPAGPAYNEFECKNTTFDYLFAPLPPSSSSNPSL